MGTSAARQVHRHAYGRRRRPRAPRCGRGARAEAAEAAGGAKVAVELHAVVAARGAHAEAAERAARSLWQLGGEPGLFGARTAALVAVAGARAAPDAALLVRLLAEEGAVGGRSLAGARAGPAPPGASRKPRPLTTAEIHQNWDLLRDVCAGRWALSAEDEAMLACEFAQACDESRLEASAHVGVSHAFADAARRGEVAVLASGWPREAAAGMLSTACGLSAEEADACVVAGEAEEAAALAVADFHVAPHLSPLSRTASSPLMLHCRPLLADWAGAAPQELAEAHASPRIGVLSTSSFVELVGAASSVAALDGIEWD